MSNVTLIELRLRPKDTLYPTSKSIVSRKDQIQYHIILRTVETAYIELNSMRGEDLLWGTGTGVFFTTWDERKTEETQETNGEISQLQKAKQSNNVTKRINFLQSVLAGYNADKRTGDFSEWKAFKEKYASEKALASAHGYTWSWKDENKVYSEIK